MSGQTVKRIECGERLNHNKFAWSFFAIVFCVWESAKNEDCIQWFAICDYK